MDPKNTSRVAQAYEAHAAQLYRVAFSMLQSRESAEDAVQDAFARYLSHTGSFRDSEHEKAWLIVTASNLCKDSLKRWWRRFESLDERLTKAEAPRVLENPVLEAVLSLPNDYKTAVYMFYYEGYTTAEIAHYQRCREATVRSRLSRARKMLKSMLGGEQR